MLTFLKTKAALLYNSSTEKIFENSTMEESFAKTKNLQAKSRKNLARFSNRFNTMLTYYLEKMKM